MYGVLEGVLACLYGEDQAMLGTMESSTWLRSNDIRKVCGCLGLVFSDGKNEALTSESVSQNLAKLSFPTGDNVPDFPPRHQIIISANTPMIGGGTLMSDRFVKLTEFRDVMIYLRRA